MVRRVTKTLKVRFNRVIFFFPFQLLTVLIKRNYLFLLYWIVLFSFILNKIGVKYGIPYLFLDPEYLGKVDFWSMFVIGLATGTVIMSFNISSYIINARRFPFLATLAKPFYKFAVNNFIVPGLFIVIYLYNFINFQMDNELKDIFDILLKVAGFLTGILTIAISTIIYFSKTNRDILFFGVTPAQHPSIRHYHEAETNNPTSTDSEKEAPIKWRVETYMSNFLQIRLVRGTEHYDAKTLAKVYQQNHRNAFIFELITMLIILSVGLFKDISFFRIPAGASVMLILSILIMLGSALRYWLKGWAIPMVMLAFIILSILTDFKFFEKLNCAYGLDYKHKPVPYNISDLSDLQRKYNDSDIRNTLFTLEKWKNKNTVQNCEKPKMIFIDVSGGGLRSALWTFHVLSLADSLMNGKLLRNTMVISGASGGMIGASYFRELYRHKLLHSANPNQRNFYESNISKDILNPIAFSIVVNDLLVSFEKFNYGKYEYTRDRAYEFEKQLNENTDYLMDKRLKDYQYAETNAEIPMMIFTPTIVEDGRRLFISPTNISYLINHNLHNHLTFQPLPDGVEYTRLLKDHDAMNTRYLSVLRMNSTFPYILPNVSLPTKPVMDVMDAGVRDNFGLKTSLKFLYVFRDWISENTSGVIFLQIRDTYKQSPIEESGDRGMLHSIFTPLGTIYSNYMKFQDYNTDELMQLTNAWFTNKIDWITFQLPYSKEQVSMNWHLTTKEKLIITQATQYQDNKDNLEKLKLLMGN
jgi:hypothetical protein